MVQKSKMICVFGGSGFVGQHVVQYLARSGYSIKIATRTPACTYKLKTYGDVGQITPLYCDYRNETSVQAAIEGCDIVINLVGVLFSNRKNSFMRLHRDFPQNLAKACTAQKISQFIHMSALGVDKSKSKYAKSKLAGEQAVLEAYPKATILRPSVIFGPSDSFFNMFAKLALFLPVLPLIGGGKTKFQPVYVGDIAQAISNIVADKKGVHQGQIYQLGGPEVVTLKEIYQILLSEINRTKTFVSLPWSIAKIQGSIFSLMPKPLLTRDQVISLQTDNVVEEGAMGFKDLGIQPTAMVSVLPRYLSNFKKGGRFAYKNDNASKAA